MSAAPTLTPAARKVVEAVHAGAELTMHYRRGDDGANERRFVLEPAGKGVFAPTAVLAARSGYLKPVEDGLPGLSVTQTWKAGMEVLPPLVEPPPFIKGSNVRDTTIPGLTVRFVKDGSGTVASILHSDTGKIVLDGPGGRIRIGRREFVSRVNNSALMEVDWTDPKTTAGQAGRLLDVAKRARIDIWGLTP